MNPEPVVLINAFEVPAAQDEVFLAAWDRARAFLSTQQGYLSTRLHRSLSPSADFRFVTSPAGSRAGVAGGHLPA